MKIIKATMSTAIVAVTLSQTVNALPQYVISADMGEFFATAINDSGSVVGWRNAPGLTTQAVLYNGSLQNLGSLGGAGAKAYGINNAGVVVGEAQTADGTFRAFTYNGTMHNIDVMNGPGVGSSSANGINSQGQIVGGYKDANNITHAYLYENGIAQDLSLPSGFQGRASFINDAGQIAGALWDPSNYLMTPSAYLYENGSATIVTGAWYGGSNPMGMNGSGVIVGYSQEPRIGDATVGFQYDGTTHNLPLVRYRSAAYAINDAGQIVGWMDNQSGSPYQIAAFLDNDQWVDLNSLALGIGNIKFTSAVAINNVGQIVVIGTDNHSYLLSLAPAVPLPASAWLLGSSLLGLTGLARRRKKPHATI